MLPTFSNKFGVHSREIKTHLSKVSQNKVSTVTCDMTDTYMPGNHCNHPDTRKAKVRLEIKGQDNKTVALILRTTLLTFSST